MSLRQSQQVGPLFKRHSDQAVEEIHCKFAVLSLRWRTVMEFACWSLPRQSLNPPRVATINQDQVIHNGWEGACQGTSWRDIKRRAVFSFRQICSDSPTHMDELWVSSKVNAFWEPRRETFSSAAASSSSSSAPSTKATSKCHTWWLPGDFLVIDKPIIHLWDLFYIAACGKLQGG